MEARALRLHHHNQPPQGAASQPCRHLESEPPARNWLHSAPRPLPISERWRAGTVRPVARAKVGVLSQPRANPAARSTAPRCPQPHPSSFTRVHRAYLKPTQQHKVSELFLAVQESKSQLQVQKPSWKGGERSRGAECLGWSPAWTPQVRLPANLQAAGDGPGPWVPAAHTESWIETGFRSWWAPVAAGHEQEGGGVDQRQGDLCISLALCLVNK